MHDRKEYVINIRNLKQLLNHGLFSEEFNKFSQKPWFKLNIDLNTVL